MDSHQQPVEVRESARLREVQALEGVYRSLDAIDDDPDMVRRVLGAAISKYRLDPQRSRVGATR